ncbi:MAG: PspC domain-containing protein, partial [Acidimicrobiales bacterium]
ETEVVWKIRRHTAKLQQPEVDGCNVVHSVHSNDSHTGDPRSADGPGGRTQVGRTGLTRSRHERVFAGVAGGLARDSDPTLLRLCLVVLIPVFGIGLIVYGLAWLLLRVDEEMRVPLPQPSGAYLFGIGLLAVGALLTLRLAFGGLLDAPALPSLVIVVGVLFIWGAKGVVEPAATPDLNLKVPTAATSAGLLLVVIGVLGVMQLSGVMALEAGSLGALLLIGIGIATVVGAFGRPWPGLVVTGTLLAFLLAFVTIIDTPIGDGIGDRTVSPDAVAELTEAQRLTMGSLVLDLTQVDFAEQASPGAGLDSSGAFEPLVVSASVMVGDLRLILPEGVTVGGDVRVGTGKLMLLGDTRNGFLLEESVEETTPEIILDLRVGLGSLVVDQEVGSES